MQGGKYDYIDIIQSSAILTTIREITFKFQSQGFLFVTAVDHTRLGTI